MKRELLEALSLNRSLSDVTLCVTKRKPFDILAEQTILNKNRGDCPSFEPLLTAFLEINLNNNPELQLVQELMTKYA